MAESELDFGAKEGIPVPGPATPRDDAGFDQREREPGAPLRSPIADGETRRGDDELDRSLRPRTLDDFQGQPRVREQLGVYIDAARHRGEPLDHALFAGPPGLGKCVTPDTVVFTTHGMVPIGSLGDLAGESWQPITRPLATLYGTRTADYFYNNGDGPTLRVTTRSGYRVEGTPNHPLLVRSSSGRLQFRRLGELQGGDEVAIRLGAQVFGSSTKLHVEGIDLPSLRDAAHIPLELTADLARLLGLLLGSGRISPGGDGFVAVDRDEERLEEIGRCARVGLCVTTESFGSGPLGARHGARSPRVARFLAGLGLARDGFGAIPTCIYRAPRELVAEFLRGVFWGVEHAPVFEHRERALVAHLQLMLTNFGIESAIAPVDGGWAIRAATGSGRQVGVDPRDLAAVEHPDDLAGGPSGDYGHGHSGEPADALARHRGFEREQLRARSHRPIIDADGGPGGASAGFGMTAAGVLVALEDGAAPGYQRGAARVDDLVHVNVEATGEHPKVRIEPSRGRAVTVAEVEPSERGRALIRGRGIAGGRGPALTHDVRALAVRSVRSTLQEDEIVELAWEPVASIEPGHAHTVDVSVPDGHTFVGNGIVCHNTTLASVVAQELGSTMHTTSGPALEKKADVAAILTSLGPRDVLFIDEIHRLSTPIEEVLYTAMEDFQIDIVLGQGPAARTLRLELEPFTLVGATTRTGLLTTPLRDRFGITQRLEYYTAEELTGIVQRSARLLELTLDDQAARELARRSRGTPRIANRLLRRVRDVAQVRHQGEITLAIAQEALDLVDIDHVGLDRIDRLVLETILTKFGGGPVGLGTLSVSIGEEPHTIEDVYEPFLLQHGFLMRTPRGRIITDRGRAHLGAAGYEVTRAGELF